MRTNTQDRFIYSGLNEPIQRPGKGHMLDLRNQRGKTEVDSRVWLDAPDDITKAGDKTLRQRWLEAPASPFDWTCDALAWTSTSAFLMRCATTAFIGLNLGVWAAVPGALTLIIVGFALRNVEATGKAQYRAVLVMLGLVGGVL